MTFWKKGFFTFLTQVFLSNKKKSFFFSIASNQFETNLTFLGQIPSLIQVLVTTESPRTWKWAPKKILGLFPKTCFRWNGPLHESLKNISYFGLQFSRDWSGVDSVIESMRKFFLTFSNYIQNVLCCCFCDTLQSSSDTVSENFRAKKSTRRVLLLRVR